MLLTVSHDFLPKRNSTRAAVVMDHFGIGFEQGRHVIAEDLELPIESGAVVLFTGASGSGKSSLMRAATAQLKCEPESRARSWHASSIDPPQSTLLDIDALELGDRILIDSLPLPVEESMPLLSACGLGEAHLLLRTPAELSDGQRYRFRLALGLSHKPQWILADEFTATLDRTLARVIAFNIRRLADRTGTGFLLATTHEDVAEDLSPDVHVTCRLDGDIRVVRNDQLSTVRNDESCAVRNDESFASLKKKRSPSPPICGSAPRPSPTVGPIQLTVPFTVPECDFPASFRRKRKVLDAVAGGILTMRELRKLTGVSAAMLKQVVAELVTEGLLTEATVDKLGHTWTAFELPARRLTG